MKTIRINTFETNSSSTHSLTITSKSKIKQTKEPLVVDNVLIPARLVEYRECLDYTETVYTRLSTKEQKASILFYWWQYREANKEWNGNHVTLEELVYTVQAECGYSNIEWSSNNRQYYFDPYGDDVDRRVDLCLNTLAHLEDFIRTVVLDDDKEIIDTIEGN